MHLKNAQDRKKWMLHMMECWIPEQEAQLQENPWQVSSISVWMVVSEQVEKKQNNVFWPDSERLSKLVRLE